MTNKKNHITGTSTESEVSPENGSSKLKSYFSMFKNAIISYSGGVDSALLAYIAHQVLGSNMLAVLADSQSLARREYNAAVSFAATNKIPLKIIRTEEMTDARYRKNQERRCYYCKMSLFEKLAVIAKTLETKDSKNNWPIFYGANKDDLGDYRPGMEAAAEAFVRAPYIDLDMNKTKIRQISAWHGLEVAEKPAAPCLASRIAYGEPITPEKLEQVEQAEDFLLDLGFNTFRVRHHGHTARIEVLPADLERILELKEKITHALHTIGFTYVAVDLDGFRSGSLNATLK